MISDETKVLVYSLILVAKYLVLAAALVFLGVVIFK